MDRGAAAGVCGEGELTAEEADAFLHGGEAEAVGDGIGLEAKAIVGDFDFVGAEADGDLLGVGVAGDVAEGFLEDTVEGEVDFGDVRGEGAFDDEVDWGAATLEGGAAFGSGGGFQAEVVEHGGVEAAGEGVELFGEGGDLGTEGFVFGEAGGDGDGGEALGEIVVEFAGDAAAFVFLGSDKAAGETA